MHCFIHKILSFFEDTFFISGTILSLSNFTTFIKYKEVLTIYTEMLSKYRKIERRIQSIQEQIQHLPPGTFHCTRNGKHYKWYRCLDHLKLYISKKQQPLAQQLALKKYLNLLLEDLSREKLAIQHYLQQHSETSAAEQLLRHPEYQKLLSYAFVPMSQELADWAQAPYAHKTDHPENLLHKSLSGHMVRSKSEAMIDMLLHVHKIPFRYECALQLGEVQLFPDFTLRHPATGATLYWEHFGMMDSPAYSQNSYAKLQLYTAHGIVPSIHLITTYETKENPLTPAMVEKIIEQYFGDIAQ